VIVSAQIGCIMQGIAIISFLGASVSSVFAMTAHKYLSIVYQRQLTEHHVSWMIFVSWLLPFSIILGFVSADSSGTLQGLQASNNYCNVAMYRSEPLNVAMSLIIFAFVFGTILMLVIAHIHIIWVYRRLTRSVESESPSVEMEKLHKDGILIKKSMAIAGIFSVAWSVHIGQIIFEVTSRKQVPLEYDGFWEMVGASIPILNLVILFVYDAKFKRNINSLFSRAQALLHLSDRSNPELRKDKKLAKRRNLKNDMSLNAGQLSTLKMEQFQQHQEKATIKISSYQFKSLENLNQPPIDS
jgi:hypothetical protein